MLLLSTKAILAQHYENLVLPAGKSFWNGDSGTNVQSTFNTGVFTFRNQHNSSGGFDYWSGFAYSKLSDTVMINYATNDCAAITGAGQGGSLQYGVGYVSYDATLNTIILNRQPSPLYSLAGVYITNSTIAYRSMQQGDVVAKKFGGLSGNDPDYFRINFVGWKAGQPLPDTVTSYLADFRDSNAANDYILNQWKYVDLSPLQFADSIMYSLESTDTGAFGMNTPAYVCFDSWALTIIGGVQLSDENLPCQFFPNPSTQLIHCKNRSQASVNATIYNSLGMPIKSFNVPASQTITIDISAYSNGLYFCELITQNQRNYTTWLKQ